MRELLELRVPEEHAHQLFEKHEGVRLGDIRKVTIDTSDPRMDQIGLLQKKLRTRKRSVFSGTGYFFAGWNYIREYSKFELENAEWFQFLFTSMFEPCAEQIGTKYDEENACKHCGVTSQLTPLRLKRSSLPKTKDFARTIANCEMVISRRAYELFNESAVSGLSYLPIYFDKYCETPATDWYQLSFSDSLVELSPETKFGLEPFAPDVKCDYVCPRGHTAGLNILSELFILNDSLAPLDFQSTRQMTGLRLGLLRPEPMIIVSQKVRKLVDLYKLKGCKLEVAYAK